MGYSSFGGRVPGVQILTHFHTKQYHFPQPFSDLVSDSHTPFEIRNAFHSAKIFGSVSQNANRNPEISGINSIHLEELHFCVPIGFEAATNCIFI